MAILLAVQTYPEQPSSLGRLMVGTLLIVAGVIILHIARFRRGIHPATLSIGAAIALAGVLVGGLLHTHDWHLLWLVAAVLIWPASKLLRGRRPPGLRLPPLAPPRPTGQAGASPVWDRPEGPSVVFTPPTGTGGPPATLKRSRGRQALVVVVASVAVLGVRVATGSVWLPHHTSTATQQA